MDTGQCSSVHCFRPRWIRGVGREREKTRGAIASGCCPIRIRRMESRGHKKRSSNRPLHHPTLDKDTTHLQYLPCSASSARLRHIANDSLGTPITFIRLGFNIQMTAPAANAPATSTNDDAKVAQEVGMMFAHEYYTFLNKEPSRLHCFYNKNSTLSHGLQGESVDVTHGQQASFPYDIILLR